MLVSEMKANDVAVSVSIILVRGTSSRDVKKKNFGSAECFLHAIRLVSAGLLPPCGRLLQGVYSKQVFDQSFACTSHGKITGNVFYEQVGHTQDARSLNAQSYV
jgi:hypothetical protein